MKVLVTGAAGMLGHAVVETFLPRHAVAAYPHAALDVGDRKAVAEVMRRERPDLVIHCAAWTDVDACERDPRRAERINAGGAANVAGTLAAGGRMVFISTDYVFDGKKRTPYKESDPAAPVNAYGRSKWKAERFLARHLARRSWILRSSWLYGEHGDNFVNAIAAAALKRKTLDVVGDQRGAPTYVFDLARQIAVIVERDLPCGVYHVTNQGFCSRSGFARAILRAYNIRRIRVREVRSKDMPRPARRPSNSCLDNGRLRELGVPLLRHWRSALRHYAMRTPMTW
jgi:dTDP-4-dehydrorhamnose reductase